MYVADTIAAIATPPGFGGVGIVRVSGPLAAAIAGKVFTGATATAAWQPHRLYHGHIVDASGGLLDEAMAVLMRAPRSYTGEDVLELHCHGSPVMLRRVLGRVFGCGARPAEPGEFTKRAFLNGRIDLAQAEAVAELIRARTPAAATHAAEQLTGGLSRYLTKLRAELIRLKALIEAQIDFAEEDFVINQGQLLSITDLTLQCITQLVSTFNHGIIFREGLRVALIGKPNVGKSSLMNALLGEDRSIVTPTAGTTRDTIEETADFAGVPVVLTDTAGLRAQTAAGDIERRGIQRTLAKIAESQISLVILDASQPLDAEDEVVLTAAPCGSSIIVLNKIDLPMSLEMDAAFRLVDKRTVVKVSAKDGYGLDGLRRAVVKHATGGIPLDQHGPILTNVRHVDALAKACESLQLAQESIRNGQPPDLVAVDVQDALDHIGAITGVVTSDDVLDRIFSEFCIGK